MPTSSRYPSSLSQRPGPSRQSRPSRPQKATSPSALSIDETYPTQPVPDHEYSSLADLLQQAGYKETRVYTPEAEKLRSRIKRTLDEDEEDLSALYGALGLTLGSRTVSKARQHQRQTITEPTLPMKSSSSLLRQLALQDLPGGVDNDGRRTPQGMTPANSDPKWWGGSIASSLGRAAQAVMNRSPPSKGSATFEEVARQVSTGVGLGLAKGGEGVRKVKSNWELDRTRRVVSESPPQEEWPPMPGYHSDVPRQYPGASNAPPPSIEGIFSNAPPPAIEDDLFGYSPLPSDYETQCEDDEAMFVGMDSFQVGSLGSSSCSSIEKGVDSSLILHLENGSTSSSVTGQGRRILINAVEYDEDEDEPSVPSLVLPSDDSESDLKSIMPPPLNRPSYHRVSTSPSPEPVFETPEKTPPRPVLKYGDRATKLRMAKSTPALNQTVSTPDNSWLGSIRSAILSRTQQAPIAAQLVLPTNNGPMRISPVTPAAPTLVTTSPIICDSTSAEAEDLPAIPASIKVSPPTPPPTTLPLRLRSSLAALRTAVGLSETTLAKMDDNTLTLSPRMDWRAQGSQFAGWNWEAESAPRWSQDHSPVEVQRLGLGIRVVSGASIDYTKSFFYKPPTPPKASAGTSREGGQPEQEVKTRPAQIAKRQRSIKSLRAALLIPVAPPPVPPIPSSHRSYASNTLSPSTPPQRAATPEVQPPVLAISSPGAWEAGLPPRELVLEGEEWDAKDGGGVPGQWSMRKGKKRSLRRKSSRNGTRG